MNRYHQMNNQQLLAFQAAGGVLVDIRRVDEWRSTGVVAGSRLLTFFAADGSSEPLSWLQQLRELVPEATALALICRTGHRTTLISEFLAEIDSGRKIYNVTEGIYGWLADRLPVVPPEEVR